VSDEKYSPKPGTVPWKVIKFLVENDDEELTRGDIVVKFDASGASIDTQLQLAVARGVLKKSRNSDGDLVWMLANGSAAVIEPLSEVPITAHPGSVLPMWGPRPDPDCDPLTVPLEDGVPLYRPRGALAQDWGALLTRMTAGQSCVLPKKKKHAVAKKVAEFHNAKRGKYSIAVLPDKVTFRLWRLE
jgi:hypothetical protein